MSLALNNLRSPIKTCRGEDKAPHGDVEVIAGSAFSQSSRRQVGVATVFFTGQFQINIKRIFWILVLSSHINIFSFQMTHCTWKEKESFGFLLERNYEFSRISWLIFRQKASSCGVWMFTSLPSRSKCSLILSLRKIISRRGNSASCSFRFTSPVNHTLVQHPTKWRCYIPAIIMSYTRKCK